MRRGRGNPAPSNDRYRGLTRGSDAALAALGQKRLAPGEVSVTIRVRTKKTVMEWAATLGAARLGEILEREFLRQKEDV
jgi:hypothetical protein